MLTSKITDTLDIPGEPGQSVTIRMLSYGALEEAADAKRDKLLSVMRSLEGVTLPTPTADTVAQAEDPATKYDRATVIRNGLTTWTYPAPVSEAVDLDDDTATWLFDAILAFSRRSKTEGEAFASGSTATSA